MNQLTTFVTGILLICLVPLQAQDIIPKREFRGAWIATVSNIDWPSKAGLPVAQQQLELLDLLDTLSAHGINAVIFQVRPAGDAFYASAYEPWSEWLSGQQGRAPDPWYDPLQFLLDECHLRGMEVHAWFNPFRAAMNVSASKTYAPNHLSKTHPEWLVQYGNHQYADPGIPEARTYIAQVIMDVVRRYPVDAVHFDDYFYPYKVDNKPFPDDQSYAQYGQDWEDRDAWRRDNVNQFVRQIRDSLLAVRSSVRFGISPFGVWRNRDRDPRGSDTRGGLTSYDDLHADVRYWLEQGWIDYVAPQIYFSIGYGPADFARLAAWWSRNSYGRQLFIGHSPYKVDNNSDPNWKDPGEIPSQIRLIREQEEIHGSAFFSANWFLKNPLGWADSLQNHYYRYPALLPSAPWLERIPPQPPLGLEGRSSRAGLSLFWQPEPDAAYYVVYRQAGKYAPETRPEQIVAVVRGGRSEWTDAHTQFLKRYHYVVTAVDANHNESLPSEGRLQRRVHRNARP